FMELAQHGATVTGSYAFRGNSTIGGTATGRWLDFRFKTFDRGRVLPRRKWQDTCRGGQHRRLPTLVWLAWTTGAAIHAPCPARGRKDRGRLFQRLLVPRGAHS